MPLVPTIGELCERLARGEASSVELADQCLARIADPTGQGMRAFVHVDAARTRAEAQASDLLHRHGIVPSRLAGVPISIKDLFDVVGQVTRAGSRVLGKTGAVAERDAPPIARLRAAGCVFVGRTNMTEFAYSGVGLNPHFGTPANPFDRATGRIPGGSTSGGAVSVADGMAAGAIGTDTGGSCRIPAALSGLVGFKPTARRISLAGCVPLSPSLDSIGCMARNVACVALLDAIMAGEEPVPLLPASLEALRLAVPLPLASEDADAKVGKDFEAALQRLSAAGARIVETKLSVFDRLPEMADRGGLVAAEAYAWHAELIAQHEHEYDPRVLNRIKMGSALRAEDYQRLRAKRHLLIEQSAAEFSPYDAIVMPTVPIVAPPFSAFEDDEPYFRLNRLLLRNPSATNLLDGCAITIPSSEPDTAPTGIMLMAAAGHDRRLLNIGAAVEAVLARRWQTL